MVLLRIDFKETMREMILAESVRSDGRGTKDIREITIDPAILIEFMVQPYLLEVRRRHWL